MGFIDTAPGSRYANKPFAMLLGICALVVVVILVIYALGPGKTNSELSKQGVDTTAQVTNVTSNRGGKQDNLGYSYTVEYQFTPAGSTTPVQSKATILTYPDSQATINQAMNQHTIPIRYLPSNPSTSQAVYPSE